MKQIHTSTLFEKVKSLIMLALTAVWTFLPSVALASDGGTAVHGTFDYTQNGNLTEYNTHQDRTIIEHTTFHIAQNEIYRFNQPGHESTVLNRITGGISSPTEILGILESNGHVWFSDPNGIHIGQNAIIDVTGLLMAAGTITNEHFLNGMDSALLNLTGDVENFGTIRTEGMTALLGQTVANFGTIVSAQDSVVMVAGDQVFFGKRNGNVYVDITSFMKPNQARLENSGDITANNGRVLLAAGDALGLAAIVHGGAIEAHSARLQGQGTGDVKVSGTIDVADSVHVTGETVWIKNEASISASDDLRGGEILIGGDQEGLNPDVRNAENVFVGPNATLSADAKISGRGGKLIVYGDQRAIVLGTLSATGTDGGVVETSGKRYLVVAKTPEIGNNGEWLIDPNNIEIVADGTLDPDDSFNINESSPFQTTGDGAQIEVGLIVAALTGGANVTLTTTSSGSNTEEGNITLTADLDYNGKGTNTLTFNAANNIIINGTIDDSVGADDTLNLVMNANTGGGSGSSFINGDVNLNSGSVTINNTLTLGAGVTVTGDINGDGNANNVILGVGSSISGTYTGGGGSDTLTGSTGDEVFRMKNSDTGTVASTISDALADTNTIVTYSGVENLAGGDGNDTFVKDDSGNIDSIDGGAGIDTLDYGSSDESGNVTINIDDVTFGSGSGSSVTDFSSIETFVGNGPNTSGPPPRTTLSGTANADAFVFGTGSDSAYGVSNLALDGNGGTDTLTGSSGADNFTISGNDTGTVSDDSAIIASVNFREIEKLDGGAGNDAFTIDSGGSLSGDIAGNTGVDKLTYSSGTGTVAISLADSSATLINGGASSGFSSIESFVGNGTTASDTTLTGTTGADAFVLGDGIEGGATGVSNLLLDGSSDTDTLTGSSGADTFTISGSNAGTLSDNSGAIASVVFSNIETFAGGAGADTLTGTSGNDNFSITSSDGGTFNDGSQDHTFNTIENLDGAAGDDAFALNPGGSLSGTLTGNTGADRLTYASGAGTVAISLADSSATLINGGASDGFSSIESFVGNGTTASDTTLTGTTGADAFVLGDGIEGGATGVSNLLLDGSGDADTLTGTSGADTFTIDGSDSGTLSDDSGAIAGVAFNNIENLSGGDDDDTFKLDGSGSLSGTVVGGEGGETNGDSLDYSTASGMVAINAEDLSATSINNGGANGFSEIESLIGNGTTSTLTGTTGNDTFTINTSNGGTLNAGGVDYSFSNFENLFGSNGDDSINFNTSSTYTINLNFNGGTGSNSISFDQGFSINGNLNIENVGDLTLNYNLVVQDQFTLTNVGNVTIPDVDSNSSEITTEFGKIEINSSSSTVVINEDNSTLITGTNTATSMTLSSDGAVTDDAGTSITVSGDLSIASNSSNSNDAGIILADNASDSLSINGNASFDALGTGNNGVGAVNVNNGGNSSNVNFGSLTFNSQNAVVIQENSSTSISGDSKANSLDLTSAGSIGDASNSSIDVTNAAKFSNGSNSINISSSTGNAKFGSLDFNTTGAITVTELGSMNVVSTITGGSVDSYNLSTKTDNDSNTDDSITISSALETTGNITISSAGSLDLSAVANSSASNINLSAADNIVQNQTVTTQNNAISIESSGGSITMINGIPTTSNNGNITYKAGGSIVVSLIDAGTGDVTLNSGGSIAEDDSESITFSLTFPDGNDRNTSTYLYSGIETNITGGYVNLTATDNIGSAEDSNDTLFNDPDYSFANGNIVQKNVNVDVNPEVPEYVFPSRGALDIDAQKLSSSSGGDTFIYASGDIIMSTSEPAKAGSSSTSGSYTLGVSGGISFDTNTASIVTSGNQTYVYGMPDPVNGTDNRDNSQFELQTTTLDATLDSGETDTIQGDIFITANRTETVLVDIAGNVVDFSQDQLGLVASPTLYNKTGDESFTIKTDGDFKVGEYEKIVIGSSDAVSVGNLANMDIAADNLFVGDVTISGNMTVDFNGIFYIIESSSVPSYDTDTAVGDDFGSDIVVRESIFFTDNAPETDNIRGTSYALLNSSGQGGIQEIIGVGVGNLSNSNYGSVGDNISTKNTVKIGAQNQEDIFTAEGGSFDYIADPSGDITNNIIEFTKPEVFEVEPAEQRVPEALREELLKLRIFARELSEKEKKDRRKKGYVYTDQIVVDELAPISAYEVALTRISASTAQDAVDFAKDLMGGDGENLTSISDTIGLAFEEFVESNPDGTAEDFAHYLSVSTSETAIKAFEYVSRFNQLFEKIGNMGLTETELSISRRNILSRLKVDGLRGREMIEFFDSFVLAKETELSLSIQ